jgi:hypothetical protein
MYKCQKLVHIGSSENTGEVAVESRVLWTSAPRRVLWGTLENAGAGVGVFCPYGGAFWSRNAGKCQDVRGNVSVRVTRRDCEMHQSKHTCVYQLVPLLLKVGH